MRAIVFLSVAVSLILSGCGGTGHQGADQIQNPQVRKQFENSLAILSDNGKYGMELVLPEQNLRMGNNTVEFFVYKGTGEELPGAEITVIPWMPAMGHGVPQKSVVADWGEGHYGITNIVFNMVGHWQLKVVVAKDGVVDTGVFDFPEVKAIGHEHMAMHAPPPTKLDTSTRKMSEQGLFDVAYKSRSGHIMTNTIHSWDLKVMTADGKPVEGARITVVGDMPEHGHGFPAGPEVSTGGEAGDYVVDNIKFSMPGWWVVNFHVLADGKMDNVSFNLMLQ